VDHKFIQRVQSYLDKSNVDLGLVNGNPTPYPPANGFFWGRTDLTPDVYKSQTTATVPVEPALKAILATLEYTGDVIQTTAEGLIRVNVIAALVRQKKMTNATRMARLKM